MNNQIGILAGAITLVAANTASAHLTITSHNSRPGGDQKVGPCEGVPRGTNVYTYEPGETITVTWDESIPHPGWFRISFDADGEDDFEPPATVEPKDLYTNDAVLLDDLFPHESAGFGEKRSAEVTLPDVECDNCTLQVIQIMLDKPPYEPEVFSPLTGDIYYRCIDLVLKRTTTTPGPSADAGGSMTDTGNTGGVDAGTTGGSSTTGSAQTTGGVIPATNGAGSTGSTSMTGTGTSMGTGTGTATLDGGVAPPGTTGNLGGANTINAMNGAPTAVASSDGGCTASRATPNNPLFWTVVCALLWICRQRSRGLDAH